LVNCERIRLQWLTVPVVQLHRVNDTWGTDVVSIPKNTAVVTYAILSADLVSRSSAPAIFADSYGLQPMFAKTNGVGKAIPNSPVMKNRPTIG
jgi:hypothetical protein